MLNTCRLNVNLFICMSSLQLLRRAPTSVSSKGYERTIELWSDYPGTHILFLGASTMPLLNKGTAFS